MCKPDSKLPQEEQQRRQAAPRQLTCRTRSLLVLFAGSRRKLCDAAAQCLRRMRCPVFGVWTATWLLPKTVPYMPAKPVHATFSEVSGWDPCECFGWAKARSKACASDSPADASDLPCALVGEAALLASSTGAAAGVRVAELEKKCKVVSAAHPIVGEAALVANSPLSHDTDC
jgi:hypothetical protein